MFSAITTTQTPTTINAGLFVSKELERCPNFNESGIFETTLVEQNPSFSKSVSDREEDDKCVIIHVKNVGYLYTKKLQDYLDFHERIEDFLLGDTHKYQRWINLNLVPRDTRGCGMIKEDHLYCPWNTMVDDLNESFGLVFNPQKHHRIIQDRKGVIL